MLYIRGVHTFNLGGHEWTEESEVYWQSIARARTGAALLEAVIEELASNLFGNQEQEIRDAYDAAEAAGGEDDD